MQCPAVKIRSLAIRAPVHDVPCEPTMVTTALATAPLGGSASHHGWGGNRNHAANQDSQVSKTHPLRSMLEQNVNPGISRHIVLRSRPRSSCGNGPSATIMMKTSLNSREKPGWFRNGRVDGGSGTRARPDPEASAIGKFKPRSTRMSHLYSNECQIP